MAATEKQSVWPGLVALLVGGYLIVAGGDGLDINWPKLPNLNLGGGGTANVPDLPRPSNSLQVAVEPLVGKVKDAEGRRQLTALYRSLADAVMHDKSRIRTTQQAADLNAEAGAIYFTNNSRKLDDLAAGIGGEDGLLNEVFVTAVGGKLPNKTLDDKTRRDWADAFRAIAWAFTQ